MTSEIDLIATLAIGFALAFFGGLLAVRLRLPPLVGYLLAGMVMGPFTPGFVANTHLVSELAELGVILLMFGVGLHFSLKELLSVRRIAVPGAIFQIVLATLLGWAAASWWGWRAGAGLVFGLALSVASTVVLLRALKERRMLDSMDGHIAVGWLIVEDLAMVLALVLMPVLVGSLSGEHASTAAVFVSLAWTLGKVALFVGAMLVFGTRAFPWLLSQVAGTGSRELFTLAVLALSLGIAYLASSLFDVSLALGAFFAGVVINSSNLSERVARETRPMQDAFAVLFFVSVGMLFDPRVLVAAPGKVLTTLGIIVLGKSLGAFAIVWLFRYPLRTALTVSASLAQIGEFSFILAGLGLALGVLPPEGLNLILAGAIFSITLNPFAFAAVGKLEASIRARPRLLATFDSRSTEEVAGGGSSRAGRP